MKKKIIIISSIVLICLISISIYLIFAHSLEKNNDETIKVADKKDSVKEKLENSVDNSEKNVEEKFEESIIDDKEDSYTQQTEKKEETKTNNPQKAEKPTSNNQSSTTKE